MTYDEFRKKYAKISFGESNRHLVDCILAAERHLGREIVSRPLPISDSVAASTDWTHVYYLGGKPVWGDERIKVRVVPNLRLIIGGKKDETRS